MHGAIAFALGIAAVAVWVLLERRQANAQARRAMSWLCILIAVQGVVGVVQYDLEVEMLPLRLARCRKLELPQKRVDVDAFAWRGSRVRSYAGARS